MTNQVKSKDDLISNAICLQADYDKANKKFQDLKNSLFVSLDTFLANRRLENKNFTIDEMVFLNNSVVSSKDITELFILSYKRQLAKNEFIRFLNEIKHDLEYIQKVLSRLQETPTGLKELGEVDINDNEIMEIANAIEANLEEINNEEQKLHDLNQTYRNLLSDIGDMMKESGIILL